jgi:type IX secretion system substrate protein/Kazal-type serine protease inhibitor-like protein
MKKVILALLILFSIKTTKAQFFNFYCIDTLSINPYIVCPPEYNPVCGCNDTTYRNVCFAAKYGVIRYDGGICEPLALDFYPNPVMYQLKISVWLKDYGDANLYIYDQFGKLEYHQFIYDFLKFNLLLDMENWKAGLHIIVLQSGENYIIKKVIKYKIN